MRIWEKYKWLQYAVPLATWVLLFIAGYLVAEAYEDIDTQKACNKFIDENYRTTEIVACIEEVTGKKAELPYRYDINIAQNENNE